MRPRTKIKSVSEIVNNPAIRIEFTPETHQDFLDIGNIADTYNLNLTVFCRHVWIVWKRKFMEVDDKTFKDKMITEVIQSMHGIGQTDIFSKYETFENIGGPKQVGQQKPAEVRIKKALDKVKQKNPRAFVKKGKKK